MPVVASSLGVTVTPLPCTTSVPKPVITFLPASVMLDKSFFANGFVALVIAVLTTPAVTNLLASPLLEILLASTGLTVTAPLEVSTDKASRFPDVTDVILFLAEIVTVPALDSSVTLSPAFNVTFPSVLGVISVVVVSPAF